MTKARPPMRITSIERLHLLDDQRAWPNWIGSHMYFEGALDPDIAAAAVELLLVRHPMITAYAPGGPRRPNCWHFSERSRQHGAYFFTGEEPPPLPVRPNIADTEGVQFVGWTNGKISRVSFLSHHAVADGLGGLFLTHDWMRIYDNLFHGREATAGLEALKPELLKQRNRLGLWTKTWLRQIWKQPIALIGAWKFLFRSFYCLALPPAGTENRSPSDWPQLLTASIDHKTLGVVRKKALSINVSLNDWLTAALFEAIQLWRAERHETKRSPWMRMIIPINLRETTEWTMPAANRTTLVQLDRREQDLNPRVRLLQGIAYEMGVIRRWQLDRMFLIVLRVVGFSQTLLAWLAKWNKPRATTLLTNLGKPLLLRELDQDAEKRVRLGNLSLNGMDLIPPIRYGMPVAFAVHQYRRQMQITAHYDSASLDQSSVQRLLDLFAARIADTNIDHH